MLSILYCTLSKTSERVSNSHKLSTSAILKVLFSLSSTSLYMNFVGFVIAKLAETFYCKTSVSARFS